jgi:hypothetical protein
VVDYRKQVETALARQKQAVELKQTRAVEINHGILSRAASQASIADVSISGLAEAIADALNAQNKS